MIFLMLLLLLLLLPLLLLRTAAGWCPAALEPPMLNAPNTPAVEARRW